MSKEAMKLALEALEKVGVMLTGGYNVLPEGEAHEDVLAAITALQEALANEALERMAENARELGLEYDTSSGTQVSKVWWDDEKLMVKPIPLVEFYKPVQQEPVAWADECRIELVNAIHFLASDFENALGVFGGDIEARRKAEGDIAHARSVASRWNWNGTSPPAQRPWVGLTDEEIYEMYNEPRSDAEMVAFAHTIEAKLKEKNT